MGLFNNELSEDKKEIIRRETQVFRREEQAGMKENLLTEKVASVREVADVRISTLKESSDLKLSVAKERLIVEKEIELLAKDRLIQSKDNELESEGQRAKLLERGADLVKANTLSEASLNSKKDELVYTQKHIDALLAPKDGIISGLTMMNTMLKEQLEYMQKVLAVAVGKIPTVDFSTIKFNIEQPAAPSKGGDKGGDKGGNQPPKNN